MQTPQTSTTDATQVVQTNKSSEEKKSMYILHHRRKSDIHPKQKYFFHPGDLRSAIERGKRHCEEIGEVFLMVRPFVSDLDMDEKRHRGDL